MKLTKPQQALLHTIACLGSYVPAGAKLRVAQRLKALGLVRLEVVGEMWKRGWHYRATLTDKGYEVETKLAKEAMSCD